MAWKQRQTYEWYANEPREASSDDLAALVRNMFGRATRVTVEEEVNECCQKWRGRVMLDRFGNIGNREPQQPVQLYRFCPECGRHL